MSIKIAVLGSSNTDMIIKTERIPKPGETVLGGTFSTAPGGKGANQAVAAARAGGDVAFIARVGTDMFGDKAVEGYKGEGIDVSHVLRDGGRPSGVALIFVDQKGENSIAVAGGANELLLPDDVRAANSDIASADILLMQLETPIETVEAAAKLASGNGVRIMLNPAPAQPLGDDLLGSVSILTPNESETELLTGKPVSSEADADAAAQILSDRGVETVLITLGSKGAYVYSPDCKRLVDGFKVEAVDTTAAGDVFSGALAVAIAEGKPMEDAVVFANAAAALSVTRLGAQPSVPTRDEIVKFLRRFSAMDL